jgi:NDP-hexose C3-ketoreductase / dTDP-4-oxo-2-deoxy-alpha-D-pentos-2-ene 2,3-reductase
MPGTDRAAGVAAVSGHHQLRPANPAARQPPDHEPGAGARCEPGLTAQVRAEHYLDHYRAAVAGYEPLAADLSLTPAQLGLAWLLAQADVTAPIIGPRTADQLDDNIGALEAKLTEDTLSRLDQLFPPFGNGGPAAEA